MQPSRRLGILTTVLALCTRSHSKTQYKSRSPLLPPIEGVPPLGVTGVVAAEVPDGALNPLPANK